jgi:Cap4 SAVED domain
MSGDLSHFLETVRAELSWEGRECVRAVYHSEVVRLQGGVSLDGLMFNRVPYFYRDPKDIAREMGTGTLFFEPLRETLSRLPSKESFKESHFAEILATDFAEEVIGLRKLYNKLSILTAENTNAFKMDVLLYDPDPEPVEFVFAEVKSSTKSASEGLPARHDQSCFADLFRSFNEYKQDDVDFDVGAIKDRIGHLPASETTRIRSALGAYAGPVIRYAGFCVIDVETHDDDEIATLATRRNDKCFDVDLLCVTELPTVIAETYRQLEKAREAASSR